jgi:hypothetical protein
MSQSVDLTHSTVYMNDLKVVHVNRSIFLHLSIVSSRLISR